MSLFSVKYSLISKQNDGGRNCLLDKPVGQTKTQCFGPFSEAAAEVQDVASQFFIQESDLWNEDDKDIFQPIKSKPKKNSPEVKKKFEKSISESPVRKELEDSCPENVDRETTKPSPAVEEDENTIDFDLAGYNLNNPTENEINFGLIDESDEDIVVAESPKQRTPSPTFHFPSKPAKKCPEPKKEDPENCFNFEVDDSNLDKGDEEEKSSFWVPKGQVNPLGLAEKTDQWLDTLQQNEAFSNVGAETPQEKLRANLTFLNKSYVEILERVMSAFENLPVDLLSQFPEFDPNVYITLRTTRRRIKAIMIKTENLLKRRNLDCSTPEKRKNSDSENDFPGQRQHSDLDEIAGKFQQQFNSPVESRTNFLGNSSDGRVSFSGLSTPNLESFSRSDVGNSSTPLLTDDGRQQLRKQGMIDYTDLLLKTPGKISQSSKMSFRNDSTSVEFDGMSFPHSEEIARKFREKFGLKTFRPNQLQAINATLLGHDCFVLMPTGGGKSLCYQLPALVSRGVTVVISPLRSLILDQVTKLLTLDIGAAHLSGDINESEASKVYRELNQREPKIKLLYVTPEKVGASLSFRNCLLGLYNRQMLARFVIDEAHCVSQWGHDFRPDYKKLRQLRENYPEVKIMALTATATPRVRTDILHQLKISNPRWFISSFNRSNLAYSVKNKKGKSTLKEIAMLIQNQFKKASGVIYCLSRNECEEVAKALKSYGIAAEAYHAGLKDDERSRVQKMWMNDKAKVVCATIAFGMGIDKLDVRFVIHYSLPKSIEGYYQESGRAGRDGEKATCMLFYSYRDKFRLLKLINMDQSAATKAAREVHIDNLHRVVAFVENKSDCRRALQLEYFGEKFDRKYCLENRNTACDNCLGQGIYVTIDATAVSQAIVSSVKMVCGTGEKKNLTMLYFLNVFRGTLMKKVISEGHDRLPMYGMGKSWQRSDGERLFRKLVMEEFLKERLLVQDEGIMFAYISFGRRGEELLKGNVTVEVEVEKRKESAAAVAVNSKSEGRIDPSVLEIQEKCYADLMEAIQEIASSINCNPNAIMNVQALRAMSSNLPETEEEMLSINHVTRANFEKYGAVLLEITKKYSGEKKALRLQEVPEEDIFKKKHPQSKAKEDSPYFETKVEFLERENGGVGKRKRTNRKPQSSKKWKGSHGESSSRSGWTRGRGRGGKAGGRDNGSGVKTIAGAKFSTMMELPTSKARGYDRPRVVLTNL